MSKKYAEIEAAKASAAEGGEAPAEGPAATKAPKFKALGPLQRAKAKADLRPRRPKDIAKEASGHRPDWPAPAPYRYLKLDKSNDTGFTRRSGLSPQVAGAKGDQVRRRYRASASAGGGGGADLEEQAC
eukprot:tig00000144_g9197.t1